MITCEIELGFLSTEITAALVSHDATVTRSPDAWRAGAQCLSPVKPDVMSTENLQGPDVATQSQQRCQQVAANQNHTKRMSDIWRTRRKSWSPPVPCSSFARCATVYPSKDEDQFQRVLRNMDIQFCSTRKGGSTVILVELKMQNGLR